jgi:hypothetical protein
MSRHIFIFGGASILTHTLFFLVKLTPNGYSLTSAHTHLVFIFLAGLALAKNCTKHTLTLFFFGWTHTCKKVHQTHS